MHSKCRILVFMVWISVIFVTIEKVYNSHFDISLGLVISHQKLPQNIIYLRNCDHLLWDLIVRMVYFLNWHPSPEIFLVLNDFFEKISCVYDTISTPWLLEFIPRSQEVPLTKGFCRRIYIFQGLNQLF